MKTYKVSITKTYTIDVQALDYNHAISEAEEKLDSAMLKGMEHYLQTGDTEYMTYDVTGSDDDVFIN